MKNSIFAVSAVLGLADLSQALLKEERLPKFTSSMTVKGSHQDHTADKFGRFQHPFKNAPHNVSSIHYEESNTISKKLTRVKGHSRIQSKGGRAIGRAQVQQQSPAGGFLSEVYKYLVPSYGQDVTYYDPMVNYWNLLYLGELYMGSPANSGDPQQQFQVVWDTGSGTLLLRSDLCTDCPNDANTFVTGDSTTFAFNDPAEYDAVTYLDGTSLSGQLGTDVACPTDQATSCANSFQFVAIEVASGLRDYEDGILGLWSGNKSGYDNTEMFMLAMGTDSDIPETTFSFYLTGLDGQSYIDFGTPDVNVMKSGESILWLDILDDNYWWTQDLTGFRWEAGVHGDSTEYAVSRIDAITDTGSSCIIGPSSEIDTIVATILTYATGVQSHSSWDYLFDCPSDANTDMPAFSLLYGGYWFEVLPEDYIIEVATDVCSICLSGYNGFNEWILGDSFMRGWYNIHNHDTNQMGFVPFTDSAKVSPVLATTTPTTPLPQTAYTFDFNFFGMEPAEFMFALAVAGVLTFASVMIIVFVCYRMLLTASAQSKNSTVQAKKPEAASDSAISLIYIK